MRKTLTQHFQSAKALETEGKAEDALLVYGAILDDFPNNTRALNAISKIVSARTAPRQDQMDALIASYAEGASETTLHGAIALAGKFPFYEPLWTLMGAAANALHQYQMAERALRQAVALAPHLAKTQTNLAKVLQRQGNHEAASHHFDRACIYAPHDLETRLNAGKAYVFAQCPDKARKHFEAAIKLAPQDPRAHHSLGTLLLTEGEIEAAIACLTRAVSYDPQNAPLLNNLASAQFALGDTEAAIETSKHAISADPDYPNAYHTLGNVQQSKGQLKDAVDSYGRAVALDPAMHSTRCNLLHFQAQICDWTAHDSFTNVAKDLGITGGLVSPWSTLGLEDNPARQKARSEKYAQQWPIRPATFARTPSDGPLRIGYVSSDLYDHATLFLLSGVLEHHDLSAFEVVVYGTNPPRESAQLDRLKASVSKFTDLHDCTSDDIVARARADKIDIAIDLKGYTHGARTAPFFSRLAPVQVNYLGYPGTLGSEVYDYIIADEVVIPADQRDHYSEQVIYLPHSYQPNDNRRAIATGPMSRSDHGLPEGALVLCSFNASYKISPREFDIWMRILGKLDNAVLWLLDSNEWATENLRHAARARGIAADRLIFAPKVPQEQHLARHRLADLFLDTFNVNAHTTASDALYTGLPIVTRAGQQFAARVGASLCHAVGLDDLITQDDAAYEAMILRLIQDPNALAACHAALSSNLPTAPLFDTARYTHHFEDGLRAAWALWQSGKPPQDIWVRNRGNTDVRQAS